MIKLNVRVFLPILFLGLLSGFAFNPVKYYKPMKISDESYAAMWKKVDSLVNEGLPKSALEVTQTIFAKAKGEKNDDHLLRAVVYLMKLNNFSQENAYENAIYDLQKYAAEAQSPTKELMHSMLGEMYWNYYTYNRWQILERSQTEGIELTDIKTWDLTTLLNETFKQYHLSIQNADKLQNTPIGNFPQMILVNNNLDAAYRPTVYDFLISRAITFYSGEEVAVTRPANYFQIDSDVYLKPAQEFVEMKIETTDTASLHYQALKMYQQWLAYRMNQPQKAAFLLAELQRLQFVLSKSVSATKNQTYFSALQTLANQHTGLPEVFDVKYEMAKYYNSNAVFAEKLDSFNTELHWYKKKALDLCQEMQATGANTVGGKNAAVLGRELLIPFLSFQTEQVVTPATAFPVEIHWKNVQEIYVQVASIDIAKFNDLNDKFYGVELYNKLRKAATVVKKYNFTLPNNGDLWEHRSEVIVDKLPLGNYIIFVANNKNFDFEGALTSWQMVQSSNLAFTKRSVKGNWQVYVKDRESGKPLAGVTAHIYSMKYSYTSGKYKRNDLKKVVSNTEGYFEMKNTDYKDETELYFDLLLGKDKLYGADYSYIYRNNNNEQIGYSDYIFTDRKIYRPGQTVYFKVLSLNYDTKRIPALNKGTAITATLLDYNYQEIKTLELTTNDFGTTNGSFVLPGGGITGNFELRTTYGSVYISVEEYKRPQFEVKLDNFDGNYMLGDEVKVNGTAIAYSGAKLSDATVKYRIARTPIWRGWWYRYFPSTEIQIATGSLVSDKDGKFTIPFKAIPDLSFGKDPNVAFNYSIAIDVVDLNGETQSTSGNITVGYRALDLSTDIDEVTDLSLKEKLAFNIFTNNLNGQKIDAVGNLKIYSLKNEAGCYKERYWGVPDKPLYQLSDWKKLLPNFALGKENLIENFQVDKLIEEQSFDTKVKVLAQLQNFNALTPGFYKMVLTAKDAYGNPVEYQRFFTVIKSASEQNIFNSAFSVSKMESVVNPGDTATFLISSADTLHLLVEIESDSRGSQKQFITLAGNQQLIKIPVLETDRGNFYVNFVAIHHNRFYQLQHMLLVPWTNKSLDISFRTFRDKLLPGQSEKWELVVKNSLGDKALAEMVAAMYDASLDAFAPNSWWNSFYPSYGPESQWQTGKFSFLGAQNLSQNLYTSGQYNYRYFPSLNWYGFSYYSYYYDDNSYLSDVVVTGVSSGGIIKSFKRKNGVEKEEVSSEDEYRGDIADKPVAYVAESVNDEITLDSTTANGKGSGNEQKSGDVKVRSNFNETAFFQPELYTNDSGEVVISFTVPESLTRWKILGFAHTQKLEYGSFEKELVTQKELMVQPNLPRFFREGDEIEVQARISNLTNEVINGTAVIELFDATTGQALNKMVKGNASIAFVADAQQNASVSWILTIPEGLGAVICRIKAISPKHTDAEERTIPVLTNRMLVTESLPLNVRGNQTKTFEFKKLVDSKKSKTLTHHKLTLEFSSNPAWYAIQSLPYLMEYPYECYEQTFSRYYANSLASYIVNSSPEIKKVFDAWSAKGPEAFLSNLEKNQELKALVLEETPWLLDAKNESERKRNVGLLFDLTRMANEFKAAEKKLLKGQVSSGAWPWFDGMPESQYITQHIVTGLGKLQKLGVKSFNEDLYTMLADASKYLDKKLVDEYKYLLKYYKNDANELAKNHLSYTAIHYLYGRSFYPDLDRNNQTNEMIEYYLGQGRKYWLQQSKYMQAMLAIIFYRNNDKTTADKIVASLKENSTSTEEMGMYFKDNVLGYYWYEAPIETQAMIIEAFNEGGNNTTEVDDLRVWLLKQKQTTNWKTTRATVEAVYALLLGGESWLQSEPNVVIELGNQTVDASKLGKDEIEPGTGYFKKSWDGSLVNNDMGKIKVTRKGEGPAWGAVYWQYFEQLDKITPHETPLKLNKQLFLEKFTDAGKKIELITDKTKLQPGDKIIVRIELRSDRDMEYIHLKDMRASGFEPINVFSGYKYQDGLSYYESTRDASTNFFIEYLRKGTYVFEYPLRVAQRGDFSNGISSIQCMYAPEFTSHSEGIRVQVK